MAKNNLTVDSIISIIKACAENGVSKISVDNLAIEFGQVKVKDTEIFTDLTQEAHDKMNGDTLVKEELKTREEQMQMLLLENPLLAEELIAGGELENDETDDGRGIEEDSDEA